MRQIVACAYILFFLLPFNVLSKESLVVFSGDLRGEIKPCGCAEESDMGGLQRKHTFFNIQKLLHSNLIYFDLGNNFPEPSEQGNLKIKLIQTALKKLNPEAVLVGPNEWLNGLQNLDQTIPYLLSNQGKNLNYLQFKTIKKEKIKFTVFGYLSPNLIYQNKNDLPLVHYVNNKLIRAWSKNLENKFGDLKILLFRGGTKELQKFEDSRLFDLIVVGSNNDDELNQILKIETKSNFNPMIPTKGQGVLSIKISNEGRLILSNSKIVPAGLSVTWLRKSFVDADELKVNFIEYNDAVKELFFTNLKRIENQQKESPFVGEKICLGCHPSSVKIWQESGHSKAFSTLKREKKHFDPECLECHVVGLNPWKNPKGSSATYEKFEGAVGFLSPQITPHLKNVQCENCHGPAKLHLTNNKLHPPIKDPKSTCVSCHHGSHSPMFNFKSYWEKIKHGLD